MSSTTEHHDYADPRTLSRGHLIANLERARGRILTLTNKFDEKCAELDAARREVLALRRQLATIKKALRNIE